MAVPADICKRALYERRRRRAYRGVRSPLLIAASGARCLAGRVA
jgi:hypothetical protein